MVNICWPHGWLKSVEIWVLVIHLRTCSSSGWVLMTNIFLGFKNMDHQLSNALSTMFLRRLVMFLHFETYAFVNSQKRPPFWEIRVSTWLLASCIFVPFKQFDLWIFDNSSKGDFTGCFMSLENSILSFSPLIFT